MDMEKVGAALAPIVRAAIATATAPLLARIKELEDREPVPGPKGDPGDPGKDGADGSDGQIVTPDDIKALIDARAASWELDFERRAQRVLERSVDRLPKPKDGSDGADGKDGVDGLGFDDLTVEQDEDGRVTLRWIQGECVKEFALRFPVFVDRGVYREGEAYERGNGATFGGSYWLAQKDGTLGKPGMSDDWRLAVKKGRDAK